MHKRVLVVGAGFAGAVVARELADHGDYQVDVIDIRAHIAGNCFDPRDPASGLRIHRYGPHIFHTSDQGVVDYLSRFTEWLPYQHRVQAYVAGVGHVPVPINRTTLNTLYGLNLADEAAVRAFLDTVRQPIAEHTSALDVALNAFGAELTELFFARYTRKMWGLGLEDLPAEVLRRLPIRYDDSDGYFADRFQAMPAEGYEGLFQRLLDHEAIRVHLGTADDPSRHGEYHHVFTSAPIDVFFDEIHGPLPYRSIQFETRSVPGHQQPVPTVNFTDDGPYTRETDWRLYPGCAGHNDSAVVLTRERPCSYQDNNFERFYPVKTVDGAPQQRYAQYQALASQRNDISFIGRCGQYRYYDMHQVVANSRMIAQRFLAS
ncbi:MAG: NAD(P)-binding protein [Planctomycetota bacterium]|jgi:UDP-galactopyranose mutase|nr:NAD(P)-binding protein [Planctomycetota bacterium]